MTVLSRRRFLQDLAGEHFRHRPGQECICGLLEHYLTERRKEIDRKYDYRYSQLRHVFGRLLYEGRVSEEDLRGLRDDKLKSIRSLAKFLAEETAA